MSIHLRFPTRQEYHQFFQQYQADPVMDPHPYVYRQHHVEHSYEFDLTRRANDPVFGIYFNDQIIGLLSLKRIDPVQHCCEIGIILANERYQGQGFGTQAMHLGMETAVREYGIRQIYADTTGSNKRMQHILCKLGFRLLEHIPALLEWPDRREDWLNYMWEGGNA